ncbi:MAG: glycine/sarcosine/betaine reductase selenoprotein B family protein [bacterium]
MTAPTLAPAEFIEATLDLPIRYIDRTRNYYLTLGYDNPYRWANNESAPFTPLRKPLAESRLAILTTGALFDPANGNQGPWAPYNANAKFTRTYAEPIEPAPDVRISHVGYDRKHTSAEDMATYFPLKALQRLQKSGRFGELNSRFFGVPTLRSQRLTTERDAPDALEMLRQDGVDVAVLVPNCPVCHQTMSLTARHLEENGIPTVVLGCAKDIVESSAVPRFVFSDLPLGNACGKPFDLESQDVVAALALDTLESARFSRTTVQSPLRWTDGAGWKRDFNRLEMTPEQIAAAREQMDGQKAILAEKLATT